ncbi:uncharacterized protein LOC142234928 isoform X2 [Haematobia irritans]|uniref:uncharacterized protein LOC142234928 isoform X2 n=1 Tax=Haematobia irritans TaxID=7368 RepID=UPI003F509285
MKLFAYILIVICLWKHFVIKANAFLANQGYAYSQGQRQQNSNGFQMQQQMYYGYQIPNFYDTSGASYSSVYQSWLANKVGVSLRHNQETPQKRIASYDEDPGVQQQQYQYSQAEVDGNLVYREQSQYQDGIEQHQDQSLTIDKGYDMYTNGQGMHQYDEDSYQKPMDLSLTSYGDRENIHNNDRLHDAYNDDYQRSRDLSFTPYVQEEYIHQNGPLQHRETFKPKNLVDNRNPYENFSQRPIDSSHAIYEDQKDIYKNPQFHDEDKVPYRQDNGGLNDTSSQSPLNNSETNNLTQRTLDIDEYKNQNQYQEPYQRPMDNYGDVNNDPYESPQNYHPDINPNPYGNYDENSFSQQYEDQNQIEWDYNQNGNTHRYGDQHLRPYHPYGQSNEFEDSYQIPWSYNQNGNINHFGDQYSKELVPLNQFEDPHQMPLEHQIPWSYNQNGNINTYGDQTTLRSLYSEGTVQINQFEDQMPMDNHNKNLHHRGHSSGGPLNYDDNIPKKCYDDPYGRPADKDENDINNPIPTQGPPYGQPQSVSKQPVFFQYPHIIVPEIPIDDKTMLSSKYLGVSVDSANNSDIISHNATSFNLETFCHSMISGTYPHPFECSKFLICSNYQIFQMECADGTDFNGVICDHKYNVQCNREEENHSLEPLSDENFGVICGPETKGPYPHPSNWRKYLKCQNGIVKVKICPNNEIFDIDLEKCMENI